MNILKAALGKLAFPKKMFLKQSSIKKVVIIVIIVAIGWFGVRPVIVGSQQQLVQYQTAQVEKGTLITSVTASGTVSSGSSASITSNATGIVQEVYVENDDTVSEGDPIALIKLDKSSEQQQAQSWASYLSAQNALNSANTQLYTIRSTKYNAWQAYMELAESADYNTADERNIPAFQIAQNNWYASEANEKNQQHVISQAQAALSAAWLSYAQTSSTITAPITGIISNLTLVPGIAVAGSSSSTSTTGTTTSSSQNFGSVVLAEGTPHATVNLSEIDVTKIKSAQKVTLTLDAFPDKTFTGKVITINTNGSVSSGVTTYPATIAFDTGVDNMYPNMAVSATIITDVKNSVTLVPSGAVQTTEGQPTVRVLRNGQVTSVPIEIGDSNDTQTEIVSGINEGDTVITGQTGSATTGATGQATSPFGNTRGGFGGTGGSSGGGGQMFIQRR